MTQAENGLIHIIIPKEPEDSDVIWHVLPLELKRLILRYRINRGQSCRRIECWTREKKKKRKKQTDGRWIRVDVASKWTKVPTPTIYNWVQRGFVRKKGDFPMKVSYNDLRKLVAERNGGRI